MQNLLKQNNIALCYEIEKLQHSLSNARVKTPEELKPYTDWVTNECENVHQIILQNIRDLELGQENLLKDILSNTQLAANAFYFLNKQPASPILRALPSDRLTLKVLIWLHTTHSETRDMPVAVHDGEFSIWLINPSVYLIPCTAQQGLLNLPLLFHEFGHLLYRCYHPEMSALVNELQTIIGDLLLPSVTRDDKYKDEQEKDRRVIIETWYAWAQEFFCDAVGFVMGGASFAYAFSTYLRILGMSEYHIPRDKLAHSSHPVTWIRIQLLADRARQMDYDVIATNLEENWNEIATALGITEDYDGFYDPKFLPVIQEKLDDMLTETAPREFRESEVSNQDESIFSSPVALLNTAWQKFQNDPENYREWEEDAIASFLNPDI